MQRLCEVSQAQLAGYEHVIGTTWPVNDAVAARAAVIFYGRLTGNGAFAPDIGGAAGSLRQTVLALRERYPAAPSLWAGYLHVGI